MTMMTENLRREARVDARVEVLIVRGRRTTPLETADVSFKGLFLRTRTDEPPPPLRLLLRLRVMLPLRQIEAHAMVVHIASPTGNEDDRRGAGVGVQFWGLAGPDRLAWDDFVRELIQTRRAAAKKPVAPADVEDGPPEPGEAQTDPATTPSGVRLAAPTTPAPSPHRDRSK